jgi:hydroxyacylglutathione hydrolase
MSLKIHQFPYGGDNYGVLLHDAASGQTACIDPGDAAATFAALDQTGWTLSHIWITHHHGDHTAGLVEVKSASGAQVIGPKGKISGIDKHLSQGDSFEFAGQSVDVIETPGHTLDMINFYLAGEKLAFTGDTLFALGCGRVFEGTPPQMWDSLQKLANLPDETVIYCSHEYTAANAAFALSVDPENDALKTRADQITDLRAAGKPTIPTDLALEKATNPFLRPHDPAIRAHLGMQTASDTEVFTEIRARKDRF